MLVIYGIIIVRFAPKYNDILEIFRFIQICETNFVYVAYRKTAKALSRKFSGTALAFIGEKHRASVHAAADKQRHPR